MRRLSFAINFLLLLLVQRVAGVDPAERFIKRLRKRAEYYFQRLCSTGERTNQELAEAIVEALGAERLTRLYTFGDAANFEAVVVDSFGAATPLDGIVVRTVPVVQGGKERLRFDTDHPFYEATAGLSENTFCDDAESVARVQAAIKENKRPYPHLEGRWGWPCSAGGSIQLQHPLENVASSNRKHCIIIFLPTTADLEPDEEYVNFALEVIKEELIGKTCLRRQLTDLRQPHVVSLSKLAACLMAYYPGGEDGDKLSENENFFGKLRGVAVIPSRDGLPQYGFTVAVGHTMVLTGLLEGAEESITIIATLPPFFEGT